MKKTIIIWDLGATKCSAAIVEYSIDDNRFNLLTRAVTQLRDVNSLTELVASLEASLGIQMSEADAICIGAAGQYDGEMIHHVRPYPYPMHIGSLAKAQHWPNFDVVHDYTPIICATFTDYLAIPENIKWLWRGHMNPHERRVTLGIGTGLGLKDGILFPDGHFWLGTSEIGHIGVCAPPVIQSDNLKRHNALMSFLHKLGTSSAQVPLTFENLLSGRGLAHIHGFHTQSQEAIKPETVGELMEQGKANDTLATFAWYLGLFIGTVQLIFMPSGGIWVTGGVALKNLYVFEHPEFFKGIAASPAYQEERAEFPLAVMCNKDHAFIGGAYYALKRLL